LGALHKNTLLGDVKKAIGYYEKALRIAKEIGDRINEGIWLGNLGNAYSDLGDMNKAVEYFEKAFRITKETGDRRSEGTLLNNLGATFEDENEYKEALACYLLAKEIHTQTEDPEIKKTESNLRQLEGKLGRKKFEMLLSEVAPRAEEIVKKEKEKERGRII
jgi:tetratricopeptide (TPR) repeat protein